MCENPGKLSELCPAKMSVVVCEMNLEPDSREPAATKLVVLIAKLNAGHATDSLETDQLKFFIKIVFSSPDELTVVKVVTVCKSGVLNPLSLPHLCFCCLWYVVRESKFWQVFKL